jgi:hypothetical protein
MKYRGENLVENSVNKGCRGWDLEDMGGDSLRPGKIHGKKENSQTGWWEHARHLPRPQTSRPHLQTVDADKLCSGAAPSATRCFPRTSSAAARLCRRRGASPIPFLLFSHGSVSQEVLTAGTGHGAAEALLSHLLLPNPHLVHEGWSVDVGVKSYCGRDPRFNWLWPSIHVSLTLFLSD